MIEKQTSLIESFWFTAAMSIVAIAMLVDKIATLFAGDTRNLIGIPIWMLITYHFLSVSYHSWKRARRQV